MEPEQILNMKPVIDTVYANLCYDDKINFTIALGQLDHLFLKSVYDCNHQLERIILSFNYRKLSHNILEGISDEQWKVICGKTYDSEIRSGFYDGDLSGDFIRKYKHRVDWFYLSNRKYLTERIRRDFADKLHWPGISSHQFLSEDFMRDFSDKLDWENVSADQILSEDFIREFADKVYWPFVSITRDLLEDFIREFADKFDWLFISCRPRFPVEFIEEFKHKINFNIYNSYRA